MKFTLRAAGRAGAAGIAVLAIQAGLLAPAVAATTGSATTASATVTAHPGLVSHQAATASYDYSCFGKWGTFLANGQPTVLDFSGEGSNPTWPDGSRGCYGISPGRAIWQINSSSSAWYPIPGNGRADYMYGATQNSSGSQKTIIVGVGNPAIYDLWSDTYIAGSGWQGWQRY
jgi:hypothetical protein